MPRFLFWNLNRRDLTRYVRYLAHEHDVDVLILAESGSTASQLLLALNDETADYQFAPGVCFYPLTIRYLNQPITVTSETEFRDKLKEIFASQVTLNVVHSIVSQSRS